MVCVWRDFSEQTICLKGVQISFRYESLEDKSDVDRQMPYTNFQLVEEIKQYIHETCYEFSHEFVVPN